MAAARIDVASVFVYAGSTLPGQVDGKDVTIIDAFEAVGACARGVITQDRVDQIERAICPSLRASKRRREVGSSVRSSDELSDILVHHSQQITHMREGLHPDPLHTTDYAFKRKN